MQRMNSRFEPWQQDAGAHMLSAILYRLKYCLILEKLHCSIWRLGEGPRTLCQAAMEPLKDSLVQYPGSWGCCGVEGSEVEYHQCGFGSCVWDTMGLPELFAAMMPLITWEGMWPWVREAPRGSDGSGAVYQSTYWGGWWTVWCDI